MLYLQLFLLDSLYRDSLMNPVEAGIISACQSGMGGTGDVAILSTADRMNLMPFAQVATRLGGAITVITMTAILRMLF